MQSEMHHEILVHNDMPKIDYCVLTVAGNPTMSGGGGKKTWYTAQLLLYKTVSGEWSPAYVGGPRRGYWRVRVVPGGETGVFVGFSLHVCGNGLWESTSVCSPGFP